MIEEVPGLQSDSPLWNTRFTAVEIQEMWDGHWGNEYDPIMKTRMLWPLLDRLEVEGKLGDVILDVGSAKHSVARCLGTERHRFIEVDRAASELHGHNRFKLRFDVEDLVFNEASTRRAIEKVAQFLGISCGESTSIEQVDTALFSFVLNYIDYRAVLTQAMHYVKPGGRLIIYDQPGYGYTWLFSPRGLQDSRDLLMLLTSIGLEVEECDLSDGQVLLVARKVLT